MGQRSNVDGPRGNSGARQGTARYIPPVVCYLAVLTVGLVIVVWTAILRLARVRRVRMAASPSPRAIRDYRVRTMAAIATAVGVTWFAVWLITDAAGLHWLHSLSLPAAVLFIAVGAVLGGYAAWIGRP
jgi:hypothetical protein